MNPAPRLRLAIGGVLVGLPLYLAALAAGQAQDEARTLEETIEVLRHSLWAQEKFILIPTGRMTKYPIVVGRKREVSELTPERLPAVYLVRWESAEAVAQAFARLADWGENALAHFLARPPAAGDREAEHYVITVKATEPPQRLAHDLFARFKLTELEARAELKTSRGLNATAARALRSGFGAAAAVHFYFPRQHNGAALLVSEDDWVEFAFTGRHNTTLRVKFRKEALPR